MSQVGDKSDLPNSLAAQFGSKWAQTHAWIWRSGSRPVCCSGFWHSRKLPGFAWCTGTLLNRWLVWGSEYVLHLRHLFLFAVGGFKEVGGNLEASYSALQELIYY